eukprot:490608-Rhodomonas_salina.2
MPGTDSRVVPPGWARSYRGLRKPPRAGLLAPVLSSRQAAQGGRAAGELSRLSCYAFPMRCPVLPGTARY